MLRIEFSPWQLEIRKSDKLITSSKPLYSKNSGVLYWHAKIHLKIIWLYIAVAIPMSCWNFFEKKTFFRTLLDFTKSEYVIESYSSEKPDMKSGIDKTLQ